MKNFLVATLVALSLSAFAKDESKTIYVGNGRYACSGNSTGCAQIDQNNRQQSQLDSMRSQQDQDRAQRYIDENRRRENEQRNDQRRYQ